MHLNERLQEGLRLLQCDQRPAVSAHAEQRNVVVSGGGESAGSKDLKAEADTEMYAEKLRRRSL